MYGKIIDNRLQIAPNPVVMDDKTIANPTADILSQQGYLPVITTNPPNNDGCYYTPVYSERDGKICQEWEEHKIDNDDKLTKLEEQITDVQEALCEIYEQII